MARRQHEGCPAGGTIYVTWIKKGARGQEAWQAVGSYCDGCWGLWAMDPEEVNDWAKREAERTFKQNAVHDHKYDTTGHWVGWPSYMSDEKYAEWHRRQYGFPPR